MGKITIYTGFNNYEEIKKNMENIYMLNKINNLLESEDTSNHELAKCLITSQGLEKDMLEYLINEKTSGTLFSKSVAVLKNRGFYVNHLWCKDDVDEALKLYEEWNECKLDKLNDDLKYKILQTVFESDYLRQEIFEVMDIVITDYIEDKLIKKQNNG